MTFSIRMTEFSAADPRDRGSLEGYVRQGQAALLSSAECLGCETFLDTDDPKKVVTIEAWTSADARSQAAREIPGDAVRGAMSVMETAPTSRNLIGSIAGLNGQSRSDREPIQVAVIIGSVRNERFATTVSQWFLPLVSQDSRYKVELIDLADIDLPAALPGNPADLADPDKRPPQLQQTSSSLSRADAIIVVTPEYNHGLPAVLKHFIDWHFIEWQTKPVAAIAYGGLGGGIRAIENLRLVLAELHATVIRDAVTFNSPWQLFSEDGTLEEHEGPTQAAAILLDRLAWWATTLRRGRDTAEYMVDH